MSGINVWGRSAGFIKFPNVFAVGLQKKFEFISTFKDSVVFKHVRENCDLTFRAIARRVFHTCVEQADFFSLKNIRLEGSSDPS